MCDSVDGTVIEEVDDWFEKDERTGWTLIEGDRGYYVQLVHVWQYKNRPENEPWTEVEQAIGGKPMDRYMVDMTYTDNPELEGYTNVVYFDRSVAYEKAIELQNERVRDYVKGLNELRQRRRKRD